MLIYYKTILWMEFWMSLEIFDIKKKVDFLLKWKLCTIKKEGEICKCKSFSFLWREASERSFVVIKMSCFSSDFSFEACVKRGRSSGMAFSTTVERKVTPCIFGAQSRDITMTVKWSIVNKVSNMHGKENSRAIARFKVETDKEIHNWDHVRCTVVEYRSKSLLLQLFCKVLGDFCY